MLTIQKHLILIHFIKYIKLLPLDFCLITIKSCIIFVCMGNNFLFWKDSLKSIWHGCFNVINILTLSSDYYYYYLMESDILTFLLHIFRNLQINEKVVAIQSLSCTNLFQLHAIWIRVQICFFNSSSTPQAAQRRRINE